MNMDNKHASIKEAALRTWYGHKTCKSHRRASAFGGALSAFTKKSLLFFCASLCAYGTQAQTTLFDSPFTSDYGKSMPYRIPAIVESVDANGNPKLIAFADKRHGGGDVGQSTLNTWISNNGAVNSHINMVCKSITYNGSSWSAWPTAETTIKEGSEDFGYGDVAIVADRENPQNIVFFCAAGNTFFTQSSASKRLQCYRFRSTDGGASWDSGTEVTNDIYNLFSYDGAFFSSGRICQSSLVKVGTHYRLYAALCVTGTNSVVLFSDDFGATWNLLCSAPAISGGDEAKCEELPNGSVLVSSKSKSTRYFRVFNYTEEPTQNVATGEWSAQVSGCTNSDGAGTNGELLIVPAKDSDGNECKVVLQSVPNGGTSASTRANVTIFYKKLDETALTSAEQYKGTWKGKAVSTTTSSYSSMILQSDGKIGFVYEEEYQNLGSGGYDIKYQSLDLSTITDEAYSILIPENDGEGGGEGGDTPDTPFEGKTFEVTAIEGKIGTQTYGMATFSATVPTMVPAGVTAYYVRKADENIVTLTRISRNMAIPANEGVILMTGSAGDYEMTEVETGAVTEASMTGNLLAGTCDRESTTLKSTDYVLALKGNGTLAGQFAFCLVGDMTVTQPANRAYLQMEAGASLVRMMFDGNETSVDDVLETTQDEAIYYDLTGRRVAKPVSGSVYIQNGKKVVK